jgi:hypothetical protein
MPHMIFTVLSDNGDIVFEFSHHHYYYIYNQETETTSIYWNINNKKIKDIFKSCIIDD